MKTALALINRVWEEIENELDTAFDAETQVALAWFATYGFDARASGELITLANAKNTPTDALFASGVFKDLQGQGGAHAARGTAGRTGRPHATRSLTVWECVQHTARVLNAEDGGGEAAARLVAQMGPKAADARALAYRLFEIATQKGWAAEALVYNELAQEWPKLEDLASTRRARAGRQPARASSTVLIGREDTPMSAEKETLQRVQGGLFHLQKGLDALRRGADEGGPWRELAALCQPRGRLGRRTRRSTPTASSRR